MFIFGIDPGTFFSAWVVWNPETGDIVRKADRMEWHDGWKHADLNEETLDVIRMVGATYHAPQLAIEDVDPRGMPLGHDTKLTIMWIGRFVQQWLALFPQHPAPSLNGRSGIKGHLCGDARANDGAVREVIISKYGGQDKAIGRAACKGKLYGIKGDAWQALAVAITHWEMANGADWHLSQVAAYCPRGGLHDFRFPERTCSKCDKHIYEELDRERKSQA